MCVGSLCCDVTALIVRALSEEEEEDTGSKCLHAFAGGRRAPFGSLVDKIGATSTLCCVVSTTKVCVLSMSAFSGHLSLSRVNSERGREREREREREKERREREREREREEGENYGERERY